jgi:hypothetical protein
MEAEANLCDRRNAAASHVDGSPQPSPERSWGFGRSNPLKLVRSKGDA